MSKDLQTEKALLLLSALAVIASICGNSYAVPVTLYYSAFDDYSMQSCSLWLNNVKAQTSTVVPGGQNSFAVAVGPGLYKWTVECVDSGGHDVYAANTGAKGYWIFVVPAPLPTTTTTTTTTTSSTTTTHPPTTSTSTTTSTTTTHQTTTTTTTTTTHPPTTTTSTTTHPPTTTTTTTTHPTTTTTTTTHPPTTTTTHPPTTTTHTTTTTTHPPTTTTVPFCAAKNDAGTAHYQGVGVTPNNGHCNTAGDCTQGKCLNNLCCPAGYCGAADGINDKCWKVGQGAHWGSANWICIAEGNWEYANAESTPTSSWCCTGIMENNYCCDANQCGYGSVQTGACYNVGQKANIGGTLNTCCSAGVWKVGKGDPCAMGFECCSGSCVSSKCA